MATCMFCGEPELVELFEVWGHEFQLETCCADLHEALVQDMQDPECRDALLKRLGIEEVVGADLRRVADSDGQFLVDFKLEVHPIRQAVARQFIIDHHDHCEDTPAGWRFGAGIWNGRSLVGVVWVGRPVARRLPQDAWVEVNRLCVDRSLPSALRWNACSQLYGFAAREAKRRQFRRIITYTLASEAGTTLVAAGWERERAAGGGSWDRQNRPREDKTTTELKVRWRRVFQAEPAAPAPLFAFANLAA